MSFSKLEIVQTKRDYVCFVLRKIIAIKEAIKVDSLYVIQMSSKNSRGVQYVV